MVYKHAYSCNMPLFLHEKLFHNVIYIEYILMNTFVFVAMVRHIPFQRYMICSVLPRVGLPPSETPLGRSFFITLQIYNVKIYHAKIVLPFFV